MKKLITLLGLLLVCELAKAQFAGAGNSANPYQISTAADLALLATNVNAGTTDYTNIYFKMMNDISLSAYPNWTPIGNNYSRRFRGKFDGSSMKISGLTISSTSDYCGLFGNVDYGCAIRNLTIESCNITTTGSVVGALVGSVRLDTPNQNITIDNCHSSGSITGLSSVGGLIGQATQISPATGGDTYSIIISNSSSSVTVVSSPTYGGSAGGVIGDFSGGLNTMPQLKYCYATGSISSTGTSFLGGLVGDTNWAIISNCYATGNVSNPNSAGGLMGGINNTTISNCYSTGQITGSSTWIHGFIGYRNGGCTITNCFWDKETSGKTTDDGATPKTTAEMKTQSTFTDAGWDFVSAPIWKIDAAINNGYPSLVRQASAIVFSSVQTTQMTIGWTNGNGSARAVFVKAANTGTATAVNNTTYAANTIFSSGTQIGSTGWYCVYNGTGSSVTVTGLTAGTDYITQVFEYNGTAGAEKYYTGTATDNPKSQTTLALPTATTNSASNVTSTGATLNGSVNANNTSTDVTFEYGLTTGYGSTVTADQSPLTGSSATSVSKAITGLSASVTYHFRVKGVNAGGTTNGDDQSFATAAAPILNNALTFNGTNQYVVAPNANIPASGDFTVSVWAKHDPTQNNGTHYYEILSQGTVGNAFYIGKNEFGKIRVGQGWESNYNYPTDGNWHNFTVVKTATDTWLYLDGILVETHGSIPNPAITPFLISHQFAPYEEHFKGSIDEIQIWNRRLSACDIEANYDKKLTGQETGLVTYYNFNETGGTTLNDIVGANNGTLYNSPVWVASGASITGTRPNVVASTGNVSAITASSATINGTIDYGTATTRGVVYGTSPCPDISGSKTEETGSFGTSNFSASLSVLTGNTSYYVRAYATNPSGTSYGTEVIFTTTAAPPTATTNSASNVTLTGATLNGSVNANNAGTAVTFEYGLTTDYGSTVTAGQSPVTGSSATSVSKAITGLSSSTTYHYRVVGVNAGGTTNGSDLSFTTACNPVSISSQSTSSQSQCIGGTFTPISVSATGDGLSYQWFYNTSNNNTSGSTLNSDDGAQTNSYTPQAGTAGTLYYYCVVTGTCGTATSAVSGAFVVNPLPAPSLFSAGSTTFCQGNSATLNVSGNALQFGSNSGVEISDNASLRFSSTQSYTVMAWVYIKNNTNTWRGIITKSRDQGSYYGIWIDDANRWVYGTGTLPADYSNIIGPSATTGWHHIAIVQTGGGNRELFVDGVSTGTEPVHNSDGTGMLRFGQSYNGFEEFDGGIMDEVSIFNTNLSLATINTWKNTSITNAHPNYANLIGYWKLDEGTGSATTADASGNGLTGALVNSPVWVATSAPVNQFSSYAWSPGSATTPTLKVTASGSYSVSVTDANGCSNTTSEITITVNTLPTATIGGTASVCKNAKAPDVIFTGANGTAPYTFTYKINTGSDLTVTTNSGNSATVPASTLATGTYTYTLLSVQDANCSQTQTGSAVITVCALPSEPKAGSNSYTYDGTAKTAAADVGTGETIDWYTAATGGTTTSAPTGTNVGTYSAYAESRNTTTGCVSANRTLITLEITKAMLTVTAEAKTKKYGEANPTLTFNYSGWMNGDTEAVLDTKPTVATTVGLTTAVGPHTGAITVSGGVDNNYNFTYVPADFTVTKAMLTATAVAKTKVYGEANPTLTFVYSGWMNEDTETVLDTKPTVATTVGLTTAVGTHTGAITVSGGVDNNYDFTYVPADFTVTKAMLTATAVAKTKVYGEANPTLTFNYSGWMNGDTETVLDTKPTVATTVGLTTAVGTHTGAITVSGGADNNYDFTYVPADFTVTKAMLTATAVAQTKVYGDANPTLTFNYSGWMNEDTETVLDTKPTVATTVDLTTAVGTHTGAITVSGGADNNYDFTYVPADFTVTKAMLTATAVAKTKVYGEANPTLTFVYSGWMNEDTETVLDTKPTVATTVGLTTAVGTHTGAITVSGGADNNYDFTYVPADFTVTKAMLTATAVAQTKVYGEANPTLTFVYSGWMNEDTETVLDTKPTVATTVGLTTAVGTHTGAITVSGGVDNNYDFTYVPADFTVTKTMLTATAVAQTKVYGEANPSLTFNYSGWMNGDTETVLDTKPTVATTVDLTTAVGTHTGAITVSGGADNNYDFTYVPADFTVTKAMLTATAVAQTKVYGEANPTLTFNYSGWMNGDTEAVLDTKPTVATTVGFTTAVGTHTGAITVSGGVDNNYDFTYVPADFTVTKTMLTATAVAQTKVYGDANPSLTFNYSGWMNGDTETVLDAKPTVATTVGLTTAVGTHTGAITVSGGVDNNYAFSYVPANFEVTKAPLTISAEAQHKIYDGTNTATVTGVKLVGVLNGDIVSLTLGSSSFENKNVGNNKAIIVTGSSISGSGAGNYTLNELSGLKANINPKQLTITNTSIVTNKMFDNATTAIVENLGTINGLEAGDASSVDVSAIANYNDAAVGSNKVITTVFTISGMAANNYIKPSDLIITGAKISEKISLSETLEVPVMGECQGEDLFIEYQILKGTPTDYRITFDAAALAAGFLNTGYLPLPLSSNPGKIYIHVPASMVEGVYTANLQFRNELNNESPVYQFKFTIKLSKNYIVKKFDDVILCDNSSNRFTTYQWYKNGQPIPGATSQFYNETSGLNGLYSLQVGTKEGAILRTCEQEIHSTKFKNATISTYPNPARSFEPFTVKITDLSDQDLKGAVMKIYNIQGSLFQTLTEVRQVNLVKLPFGEYIGTVITSDQKRFTYKIIVADF